MRRQSLESGWANEQDAHDALRIRRWPLFSNAIWNPSSLNYRVAASQFGLPTLDHFRFGDDTPGI
jgi:hypothetical protein